MAIGMTHADAADRRSPPPVPHPFLSSSPGRPSRPLWCWLGALPVGPVPLMLLFHSVVGRLPAQLMYSLQCSGIYTLCPQKSEHPKHFAITAVNLHQFK